MLLTKRSELSGEEHTMDLPITKEDLERYERGEGLIHVIFPHLTATQREFIMTGNTEEEWEDLFKDMPEQKTVG
jgi:peptidase E